MMTTITTTAIIGHESKGDCVEGSVGEGKERTLRSEEVGSTLHTHTQIHTQ
jgi:hypothetical protein